MRVAVLADVHGNLPALEAVLEDIAPLHVEGIWTLGDLTSGTGQNQVIRLLRSLDACMIRGNNENYLLDCESGHASAQLASRQWAVMRWAYQNIERELLNFIADLPEQCTISIPGMTPVRLVHGSPRHTREWLFPDRDQERMQRFKEAGFFADGSQPGCLKEALDFIEESVLACGHTHIPWVQQEGSRMAFNPGAAGSAIDGDIRAQYALLTWQENRWQVELKAVPYDLEQVWRDFTCSGLLEEGGAAARAIWLGVTTGQNVLYALVVHAFQAAAQAGLRGIHVVPDDIWERAVDTFDWDLAASGRPLF